MAKHWAHQRRIEESIMDYHRGYWSGVVDKHCAGNDAHRLARSTEMAEQLNSQGTNLILDYRNFFNLMSIALMTEASCLAGWPALKGTGKAKITFLRAEIERGQLLFK